MNLRVKQEDFMNVVYERCGDHYLLTPFLFLFEETRAFFRRQKGGDQATVDALHAAFLGCN